MVDTAVRRSMRVLLRCPFGELEDLSQLLGVLVAPGGTV